jgi:hypothetical protein
MDAELLKAENEIAQAAEKITKMEPGLELKMNAFIMWAGPLVLAALGVAPSESSPIHPLISLLMPPLTLSLR